MAKIIQYTDYIRQYNLIIDSMYMSLFYVYFLSIQPPPEERKNNTISKRNFAENFPFLWPNGVIPYVVDYASFGSYSVKQGDGIL